jgi:4-hydroxy-tetrahydrodipicolinate synthase
MSRIAALDASARGAYLIAVTPFLPDGALDPASADSMVDFYLAHGATGLTLLGVLGEAPKLTQDEARRLTARVVERVGGRVPVVCGVSAPGFAGLRELAAALRDAGASGLMLQPGPGLRSDRQILDWFAMAVESIGADTPWVLQDHPIASGVTLPVPVVLELLRRHERCTMIKHEDSPGLAKLSAYRAASARGDVRRVSILTGNGGGLFLPEEMARGADGAMTGFPYPEMMVGVVDAFARGDPERGRDLFDAYLPLARYEQQPGIGLAVRKHLMVARGAIAHPTLRRPGPSLSAQDLAEVERLVERQARRLAALG